jgi:hypothetical protein
VLCDTNSITGHRLPVIAVDTSSPVGSTHRKWAGLLSGPYKCGRRISGSAHNPGSLGKTTRKWQFAFPWLPSLGCVKTGYTEISTKTCCVGLISVAEGFPTRRTIRRL